MIFSETVTRNLVKIIPNLHKFITSAHGTLTQYGSDSDKAEIKNYQEVMKKFLKDLKDSAEHHNISV